MGAVKWHRQGAALVGDIVLDKAQVPARVVLVGPRSTPKGAVLVTATPEAGQLNTQPFHDCLARVPAAHVVEVVCMQERLFGDAKLPAPAGL
jgi:hypothetical protein